MTKPDDTFIADLKEGRKEALERFYHRLAAAKSDEDFWSDLCSIAQGREEEISQLRHGLGSRGFDWFVKNAPMHLLIVFLFAAMSFAACNNGAQSNAPMVIPVTAPALQTTAAAVETAPSTPVSDEPNVMMPTPPTAEELKASLVEFIKKAELPYREKRRLLDVTDRAYKSKLVDSEADLSQIFQKSDPKEIADALESLVMFKKVERKWEPSFGALYKGVSFC